MGESRAGFHSKHLLRTNNAVGAISDYKDTEMEQDMKLELVTLCLNPTLPASVTCTSKNKLHNHRILDSSPCATIAR